MILAGEIEVGAKLNEMALSAGLGVSRGPVRESFRALEETGLVRIEKNRGVFVREISLAEASDIYEIRATFDQMAGRKLAQRISPEQLASLRDLLGAMEAAAAASDLGRYHALNLRFHDALVEYANNPKLLQMYRRLVNELGPLPAPGDRAARPAARLDARAPAHPRLHRRRRRRSRRPHALRARHGESSSHAAAARPRRPDSSPAVADLCGRRWRHATEEASDSPAPRGHAAEGVIKP